MQKYFLIRRIELPRKISHPVRNPFQFPPYAYVLKMGNRETPLGLPQNILTIFKEYERKRAKKNKKRESGENRG